MFDTDSSLPHECSSSSSPWLGSSVELAVFIADEYVVFVLAAAWCVEWSALRQWLREQRVVVIQSIMKYSRGNELPLVGRRQRQP